MEKIQVLKLYEDYLQRNPQDAYIRTARWSCALDDFVDTAYIQDNQVLRGKKLPEEMTLKQLCELDDQYSNELKWNIIESRISENQIVQFEQKNSVTFPKQFREFLQSYSFLNEGFYAMGIASYESDFQGVYDRKTGEYIAFSDDDMDRDEDLIGEIQLDFFNVNKSLDCMKSVYFKHMKMIHLGNLDTGDLLLLDCETGEVQSWQHDEIALEVRSRKEFLEKSLISGFWFRDFDTFLEWVYGKSIYDEDKAEEEREKLVKRKQGR